MELLEGQGQGRPVPVVNRSAGRGKIHPLRALILGRGLVPRTLHELDVRRRGNQHQGGQCESDLDSPQAQFSSRHLLAILD